MATAWGPMFSAGPGGGIALAERNRARQDAKARAEAAAKLAQQYLSQWNASKKQLEGYYNSAIESLGRSWDQIDSASEWIDTDLREVIDDIDASIAEYRTAFTGLRDESIAAAKESTQAERELTGTIMGLATPDYEGAAGIAKADAAMEADRSRRAEARELQGMGISPTSGSYRDRIRKQYLDDALTKVLSGNFARMGEKARVSDLAIQGLNAIDPSTQYGVASGISKGDADLLKQKSDAISTGITAKTNLAQVGGQLSGQYTNIANGYGTQITQPLGELYSSNMGISLASDPKYLYKKL